VLLDKQFSPKRIVSPSSSRAQGPWPTNFELLTMMATCSLKTSPPAYAAASCHTPENHNPRLHHCENPQTHISISLKENATWLHTTCYSESKEKMTPGEWLNDIQQNCETWGGVRVRGAGHQRQITLPWANSILQKWLQEFKLASWRLHKCDSGNKH